MVSSLPSTTHSKAIEKREPDSSCKWRVLEWKAIVTNCSTGNSSQILGTLFPHEESQIGETVKSLHLCPWRDWRLIWTSPWVIWSVLGLTCYVIIIRGPFDAKSFHSSAVFWLTRCSSAWQALMTVCPDTTPSSAVARWTKSHILRDVLLFAIFALHWLAVQLEPKCTMQEK